MRNICVSDHAVLRYIERHYGVDMVAMRKEILTDKVIRAIECGVKTFTLAGLTFIVENNTVITGYKPNDKRTKTTTGHISNKRGGKPTGRVKHHRRKGRRT